MVTYTNSSLYWSALKPRVNIYALNDISYSSPIYTYNPFTDVGVSTKPVSLSFDSQTTNAGSFSVEIEDADSELDMDTFTKGNRIVIDCSKNGSTWQPAFKGLIRSSEQTIYAPTGRNFTLSGYSYIVRLNERVLNVVKESSLTGTDYDRTDSNMFTNNLVENLLDDDQNYVFSSDDFDLYTLPSPADISTSSITEWLPRLDAELVTVGSAIDSILEYSNSLITVDLSTDKWAVYNPDLIQPLTQVFLITDNMVQAADDADITMYPLLPYKYNVSYDYPDSGSRLIVALNTGGKCAAEESEPVPDTTAQGHAFAFQTVDNSGLQWRWERAWKACIFKAENTDCRLLRLEVGNYGDLSAASEMTAQIRSYSALCSVPGSQIGSDMTLYRDRTPGKAFPEFTSNNWLVGLEDGNNGVSGLTVGNLYWIVATGTSIDDVISIGGFGSGGGYMSWIGNPGATIDKYPWGFQGYSAPVSAPYINRINNGAGFFPMSPNSGWESHVADDTVTNFYGHITCGGGTHNGPLPFYKVAFNAGITGECGGSLTTAEIPEPQFVVAHDLNATNRLGMVERAITTLPRHITTLQTINEYLYAKLYVSAKPRFTFDYPSVSMPNRVPKAGDIVTHVSRRANVGLKGAPLQTGVIMSVNYNFDQGDDGVLGLRNVGLQTTGIRRGSY